MLPFDGQYLDSTVSVLFNKYNDWVRKDFIAIEIKKI